MKTLLMVATRMEIQPLLTELQVNKVSENFYTTNFIHLGELDIMISGIGIPFTMFHLMEALSNKKYSQVINAGVAGSFVPALSPGTMVNVVQEEFADLGYEDKKRFFTIFESHLLDMNVPPFRRGKLVNPHLLSEELLKIQPANSITVNKVTGSIDTIDLYRTKFNPEIENMEGAAIFYACLLKNIPFAEIRCISNMIEERDTSKWKLDKSISTLNQYLVDLFNIMNKKV